MGRGVYTEHLNNQIQDLETSIQKQTEATIKENIFNTLFVLIISIIATSLTSAMIARRIKTYDDKIMKINLSLEDKVKEKTSQLQKLNQNLKKEVDTQLEQIRQQDVKLLKQAKHIATKELLSNIAHHWRQPLNAISINIQMLEDDYEEGLIDEKYLEEFSAKMVQTIDKLSQTIENFQEFFIVSPQKQDFVVKDCIENVLRILEGLFQDHQITVHIDADDYCTLHFYKSEFEQVILNLLLNAKDAFLAKNIENPTIDITVNRKDHLKIEIIDNGGGVDPSLIDSVFEPYTTTKFKSEGTGLGLYICKSIIQNYDHGDVQIQNFKEGAKVTVVF